MDLLDPRALSRPLPRVLARVLARVNCRPDQFVDSTKTICLVSEKLSPIRPSTKYTNLCASINSLLDHGLLMVPDDRLPN